MTSISMIPLLFLTGMAAGWVDSIAGGGGLITIPVLFLYGLPPQAVLATNKLQATFGSGSAMRTFLRSGTVRLGDCWWGILFTAIGATLGTLSVERIAPDFLRQVIPWLLIVIALYSLLAPRFGEQEKTARWRPHLFFLVAGTLLGFYDGFFGPGTGSFWVMAILFGLGYDLTRATGTTKVMNFTSNVFSLVFFLAGGAVLWREGLIMGLGQLVGAWFGSHLVVRKGTGFIRPIFITMVLLVTAKLLWDNYR